MNVLVYSGPEVLQSSLNHVLTTLRGILSPHYSVQIITQQALKTQPWATSCALLVFPETCAIFQSTSSTAIKDYIESGGAFLGFASGASCSSRDQGGTVGIAKELRLYFYDKSSTSYIYPDPPTDIPSRSVAIESGDGRRIEGIYEHASSTFVGFEKRDNVTVLARYAGGDTNGQIAGLICNVGSGKLALWAPNLENPLTEEPALSLAASGEDRTILDKERGNLLRTTLLSLDLRLPSVEAEITTITSPLPQFLTSHPSKPFITSTITELIAAPSPGPQLSIFEDSNDTFHFHHLAESKSLVKEVRNNPAPPGDFTQPKHVIICAGEILDREQTPLFDIGLYYESLSAARIKQGCSVAAESWGFGEALFYGEAVTSTQTMLDRNPRFLSRLPTPLVSLASYQLAGRGRGSNVWLSQSGGLQFSTLMRVSLSSFPASKLVFVQYLFALAVVEACRDESVLGLQGKCIRLKWPNDLYAVVGPGEDERKKIGGILVNTSFTGGNVDIVVGCGLNVLNLAPVFSLAQLLSSEKQESLSLERTVTAVLSTFEVMWDTFVKERGSFDSFMSLYLERWLHSDQLVTLTTVTPPKLVRITGITPDHGLLRTMPERAGWSTEEQGYIDLQPDGNSFDLMAGLIKSKN